MDNGFNGDFNENKDNKDDGFFDSKNPTDFQKDENSARDRYNPYFNYSNSQTDFSSDGYSSERAREAREYAVYKKERSFSRFPLILSLWGLLLSLFCGLGVAFSIPALILSLTRYSQKENKTLRWAIVISIVATIVSLVFIATMVYAIVSGYYAIINLP